ncbi:MAG TPA: hypothetical protein VLA56_22475 [Pseudomonadales bacterium]|nr:hypothetical protein [Pseudomonadales bacterium]
MPAPHWREERRLTEQEYLPLITISIATIQGTTALRDLILFEGGLPGYLLEFSLLSTAVSVVIALFSQTGRVPLVWVFPVVFFSIICLAARPVVTLMVDPSATAQFFTATLVGSALSSLFVLFRRQFFVLNACMISVWTGAALFWLTSNQALMLLYACTLATGCGYLLLRKRINTLIVIFELRDRVENLESILPMCSGCKKTRDEEGAWMSVERYIEGQRKGLQVSHGLCEDCKEELYGDFLREVEDGASPARDTGAQG